MKKEKMYYELAKYYDMIYSTVDYRKESEKIRKIIMEKCKSGGKELLDVACGTGRHLNYLKKHFSCTGIDLSSPMLREARKKVKSVKFVKGDMKSFNLNKKFDAIICMFRAIGYVKTYPNLRKTIKNFAKHLKPGGVLIFEPWYSRQSFKDGSLYMMNHEDNNFIISMVGFQKMKGRNSEFCNHYLIGEKNKGIKYFSDRHEAGLFDVDKTLEIMKEAGLRAKFSGRGFASKRECFLGIKEI